MNTLTKLLNRALTRTRRNVAVEGEPLAGRAAPCAGCGDVDHADPGSQLVPDPAQFDPQRAVERKGALTTVTARKVWCDDCRGWYHAVGCYSTHRR
jgi:hypothetical protein